MYHCSTAIYYMCTPRAMPDRCRSTPATVRTSPGRTCREPSERSPRHTTRTGGLEQAGSPSSEPQRTRTLRPKQPSRRRRRQLIGRGVRRHRGKDPPRKDNGTNGRTKERSPATAPTRRACHRTNPPTFAKGGEHAEWARLRSTAPATAYSGEPSSCQQRDLP